MSPLRSGGGGEGVVNVCAHSRTAGIDTFAGEEHFVLDTRPPRLVVDSEAIDHVLEMDIFRILDVEVARSEDVADGAVQRRESIHRIRRLEERVWGL